MTPDAYFLSGLNAVTQGGVSSTTVVVAPYFQTSDDAPESDEPFWSSPGWKRGNLSRPEGPPPRVSSYAAIDRIVEKFLDAALFPAIREIVVTGHSAGGQVVHRYAASSTVQDEGRDGVTFRYVVANPSTYLYLGPERESRTGDFAVPGGGCDDYDEWHYGLLDRNSWAERLETDTIRALLSRRDVRILVGDADTLSASLDVSCGANLQGLNRYLRGTHHRALHGFPVRRSRPHGNDRAGRGAFQPVDVAVGRRTAVAVREPGRRQRRSDPSDGIRCRRLTNPFRVYL